jgi:hypothetical protein
VITKHVIKAEIQISKDAANNTKKEFILLRVAFEKSFQQI